LRSRSGPFTVAIVVEHEDQIPLSQVTSRTTTPDESVCVCEEDTAVAAIIAEVGTDMSRFPTAGHLCSWAKFSPGINSSAGKSKGNGSTGHGNRYLARALGEVAVVASRTDTFLGARYRRIARRRGKKRAIVAVGRSILVIVWHLLQNSDTRFHDLGAEHFTRYLNPDTKKRTHIRQLEALGYTVTLTPAA
jgi:transposase